MNGAYVIMLGWGMMLELEITSASTFIYNSCSLYSPYFVRLLGAFGCNILQRFKACSCHKPVHKRKCFQKPTFIFWPAFYIKLVDQSVSRFLRIQTNPSFLCS